MAEIECLLVSKDREVHRVITRVMKDMGMMYEMFRSFPEATKRLTHWKFDAVILDCEEIRLHDALPRIRACKRNKDCIAFAIVNNDRAVGEAFNVGATFAVSKPLGMGRAARLMHAAHSLIVRQRVHYYRLQLDLPAYLTFGSVREFPARITNLSEGGARIVIDHPVMVSGPLHVRFVLPETLDNIETGAELVWANAKGQGGIRFVELPSVGKRQLLQWLADRVNPETLGLVSAKANGY